MSVHERGLCQKIPSKDMVIADWERCCRSPDSMRAVFKQSLTPPSRLLCGHGFKHIPISMIYRSSPVRYCQANTIFSLRAVGLGLLSRDLTIETNGTHSRCS